MIVIVGARDLWPTPALAGRVLAIMISTDETIGIRGPLGSPGVSSMTEEMAFVIGQRIGRRVVVFRPFDLEGNARNWLRDNRMVSEASEVHAFFGPDSVEGGTEHIVTVALRIGKPTTAYAPNNEGELVVIGSDEGGYFLQAMAENGSAEWTR